MSVDVHHVFIEQRMTAEALGISERPLRYSNACLDPIQPFSHRLSWPKSRTTTWVLLQFPNFRQGKTDSLLSHWPTSRLAHFYNVLV